jgi:hypothetical protein
VLNITVPGTIGHGDSYARFRFSSVGGLAPTGLAADGEVEDYRVTLVGNPWHNALNPLDVNGDTFVTPIDALLIINYLNNNGAGMLPLPPPVPFPGYLDVNASNPAGPSVEPADALLVINRLNSPNGEGELAQTLSAMAPAGDRGEGEASLTVMVNRSDALIAGADLATAPAYFAAVVDHRISESTVSGGQDAARPENVTDEMVWNAVAASPSTNTSDADRLLPEATDDLEDMLALLSQGADASETQTAHDAFFSEFA